MKKPSNQNISPKISAGNKFVSRLNPQTRERLERIINEPIAAPIEPEPPELEPERNRGQKRAAERAQDSAALARRRALAEGGPDPTTPPRSARELNRLKDQRHLERLRAKLEASGYDLDGVKLHTVPTHLKIMVSDILADSTGKAANIYLNRCFHQIAARLIRQAARGQEHKRPLTSIYARRVVALGLVIVALSKRTRAARLHSRLTKGIPENAFLALLRDPHNGQRPGLSALTGRHKPGAGSVGYLDALKATSLVEAEQLPKSRVTPSERLGDYALNRYHIIARYPTGPLTEAELDEILRVYPYTEIAEFEPFSRSHPPFLSESPQAQAQGP